MNFFSDPRYFPELAFMVGALGGLLGLLIYAWVESIRARRADDQMRRGMRELRRQGRLAFRARESRGYTERSEL